MHFLFAWRYFRAKKSTNAINIIAWISIVAMVIGTTVLILVLSVFNGFEGLVKGLYSSFYPDLKVLPASGKVVQISPAQLQKIKAIKAVRNFSLVTEEKALLQNGDFQSVIYLKGVDANYRYVAGVADHVIKGNFALGNSESPALVMGAGIENAVGVQSDRNIFPLIVYLPKKGATNFADPMNAISSDTISTAGTFVIQQDFDNKYAITNIDFVKQMLGMGADEYSGLEIALHDPAQAEQVKPLVQQIMSGNAVVQTRFEQNQGLYSVMRAEKWVIYAVLSLILVVAAFNMIGALTMLVLEKEKDISVLHALGGSRLFIQKIFLSEGMLLAIIGGGIGMLLAILIAWLQVNYKLIPLQGGSFLIDYFPVTLQWMDFLLVGVTVFVIAMLAAYIPSRKAAKQHFSLRSE